MVGVDERGRGAWTARSTRPGWRWPCPGAGRRAARGGALALGRRYTVAVTVAEIDGEARWT